MRKTSLFVPYHPSKYWASLYCTWNFYTQNWRCGGRCTNVTFPPPDYSASHVSARRAWNSTDAYRLLGQIKYSDKRFCSTLKCTMHKLGYIFRFYTMCLTWHWIEFVAAQVLAKIGTHQCPISAIKAVSSAASRSFLVLFPQLPTWYLSNSLASVS
jgi:hypothetical protein